MTFHIITLFPKAFDSYLGESILKRAIEDKKIRVKFYNPRDFADNKLKHIDKPPYGGGPGMVIQALPVIRAIETALKELGIKTKDLGIKPKSVVKSQLSMVKMIWLTPSGRQFETSIARKFAKFKHLIIICGRYEGIDARVKRAFKVEEVSIGPFVLTGGELPALAIMDSVSRQIEGVLGNFDSREEERAASSDVYTRPEVFEYKGKKLRVPKILLSGNHKKIEEWKKNKNSKWQNNKA